MYENLSLEEKVQRLLDMQEIRNLMGKYEYYSFNNDYESIMPLFSKREDAYVDCEGVGVLEGPAGIRKFMVDWHTSLNGEDTNGIFSIHAVTTEVIEVAEDGKTARGIWISPGAEAKHSVRGDLEAYWIWGKYPIDFIKEDGEWHFWKFRIPHDLLCDFHHSWTELHTEKLGEDMESEEEKPVGDRPSVFPDNFYSTDKPVSAFFVPPVPYKTEKDLDGFWGEPYTLDE